MITSSLPPELKVMIASGFLLAGGLLALRYPAVRESAESVAVQTAGDERHPLSPSSPTTPPEPASNASSRGAGVPFESIEDFVRRAESRESTPPHSFSGNWLQTSMPEPGNATDNMPIDAMSRSGAETPTLDRTSYADMPVTSTPEPEPPPKPEYKPFQVSPSITMPEPNPALFAEPPTPPNTTAVTQVSDVFGDAVPGVVVSPSAIMQPSASFTKTIPVEPSRIIPSTPTPLTPTTVARPVMARSVTQPSEIQESSSRQRIGSSVVASAEKPRGDVMTAPARTVIVPNR